VTVRACCDPGSSTPLAGLTCSQAADATVAVNANGDPLVESFTICGVGALGGEVNVKVFALSVIAGRAAATTSVAVTVEGEATPVTVMLITAE
jgi:hypothetical protein